TRLRGRCRRTRSRLRLEHRCGLRRLGLAGPGEFTLLGFDKNGLGAPMREVLPHRPLLHAGTLDGQGLLRVDAERLVVTRFRIAHSQSFYDAAPFAEFVASPRTSAPLFL